jgi:hypothetical protein
MTTTFSSDPLDPRTLILEELEAASEPLLYEVLDLVRLLKTKHEQEDLEDQEDLADAQRILAEIDSGREQTVPWEAVKERLGL